MKEQKGAEEEEETDGGDPLSSSIWTGMPNSLAAKIFAMAGGPTAAQTTKEARDVAQLGGHTITLTEVDYRKPSTAEVLQHRLGNKRSRARRLIFRKTTDHPDGHVDIVRKHDLDTIKRLLPDLRDLNIEFVGETSLEFSTGQLEELNVTWSTDANIPSLTIDPALKRLHIHIKEGCPPEDVAIFVRNILENHRHTSSVTFHGDDEKTLTPNKDLQISVSMICLPFWVSRYLDPDDQEDTRGPGGHLLLLTDDITTRRQLTLYLFDTERDALTDRDVYYGRWTLGKTEMHITRGNLLDRVVLAEFPQSAGEVTPYFRGPNWRPPARENDSDSDSDDYGPLRAVERERSWLQVIDLSNRPAGMLGRARRVQGDGIFNANGRQVGTVTHPNRVHLFDAPGGERVTWLYLENGQLRNAQQQVVGVEYLAPPAEINGEPDMRFGRFDWGFGGGVDAWDGGFNFGVPQRPARPQADRAGADDLTGGFHFRDWGRPARPRRLLGAFNDAAAAEEEERRREVREPEPAPDDNDEDDDAA